MIAMRAKDPGEGFFSAYVIRPAVWLAYQFSPVGRAIRATRRRRSRR